MSEHDLDVLPAGETPDTLAGFLDEIQELPCAALFALVARQVETLDVTAHVRPLGVVFRAGAALLCELSLYGELFIARVGPELAVEYRVRHEDMALAALDHVLRTYVQLLERAARP